MEPLYKKFSTSVVDENGLLTEFKINCPDNFNFAYDVVDEIARIEPEKTALVWCNVEGDEKTLTFGEMSALSSQAAHVLAKNGVKKGDRVMLILKRHYEYWYTLLALHKLGAVAIPATYMLTAEDIRYRVRSANISAVVFAEDDNIVSNVKEAASDFENLKLFNVRKKIEDSVSLDELMKNESTEFDRIPTKSTEPTILYFTSGTTGYPKAVVHDYSYPLAHIITAKYWQNVADGGLHLTVADTGWGKASWGKIYGQWLSGCAVMVYDFERFVADDLVAVINKYNVTSFCAPPTIYRFFVKSGLEKYNFSSVKYATTAGEALNPDIIRQFYEATGLHIKEGYGQTETTLVLGNLYGDKSKDGSMGKPSPLYNVKIVDEDGNDVKPGEQGEIVIIPDSERKFGLCISYDNDAESDARAWKNGVYHTGDTAYYDEDGYYWYVGRADDIIKSSGYRIGPFEVESALIKHPSVMECAITGVPDEERGYIIKATVVLRDGYKGSDELVKELQTFVKKTTAPYKYPRIIEFVDELPKTISGKIKRFEIRNNSK